MKTNGLVTTAARFGADEAIYHLIFGSIHFHKTYNYRFKANQCVSTSEYIIITMDTFFTRMDIKTRLCICTRITKVVKKASDMIIVSVEFLNKMIC